MGWEGSGTKRSGKGGRRLVRTQVVFVKAGLEAAFPAEDRVVSAGVSEEELRNRAVVEWSRSLGEREELPPAWRRRDYPPGGELPPGDGKYVRVSIRLLACYDSGERGDREERTVEALDGIADAISGGGGGDHFVKLPASGVVAGPLDGVDSEFGDEFYGLPAAFGQSPAAGETKLAGFLEVVFQEPEGRWVDFDFRYLGVGTPVEITFGGGQQFTFDRTRCFPMPFMPDQKTPAYNRGRLDLHTGRVEEGSVQVNTIFQGTTIGRTDRMNRIAYAFPYMFPPFPPFPPPEPLPMPLPPGWRPPPEDTQAFADLHFHYDWDGHITGAELHSETIALVGLFPVFNQIPGMQIFPPFAFGPEFDFFFANPSKSLVGTPAANQYTSEESPDGTPTDISLYFHPHIDLVSEGLREVPPDNDRQPPPCLPHGVGRTASAVAEGRLYVLGGLDDDGITGRVQIYDPEDLEWHRGPDLPTPVFGAQAAAVGSKVYVLGGWSSGPSGDRDLSAAVQVLDTASDTWSEGPELPTPVAEATATAVGRRIVVVSGWEGKDRISDAVQILDTDDGAWSDGADASLPAVAAAAVAVEEKIYVIGGRFAADQISSRTTVYDTEKDIWNVGPELTIGVIAGVAGHLEGRLYLVGGRQTVGGEALRTVQEWRMGSDHWRFGLPQPVPTAGSGGGTVGDTLYVVGGRVMTGSDPLPGQLTDLVQTFHTYTPWTLCGSRPVFTSTGVLNAAALVGVEPGERRIAPGARAVIIGDRFTDPGQGRAGAADDLSVRVSGKQAKVLKVQRERVDFVVPEDAKIDSGKMEVEVTKAGSPKQAPPVRVPAAASAPGLFTYTYGETHEPTFLEPGPALACNGDGTLNFANQAAAPGDRLVLYATGLGKAPKKAKVEVRMGGKRRYKATVEEVRPSPQFDGVVEIEVTVPKRTGYSNNVRTVLTYDGDEANEVVVSIAEQASRSDEPVPCHLGLVFVFGPVGRSLMTYRPVEEADLDVDTEPNAAFWRATAGPQGHNLKTDGE